MRILVNLIIKGKHTGYLSVCNNTLKFWLSTLNTFCYITSTYLNKTESNQTTWFVTLVF